MKRLMIFIILIVSIYAQNNAQGINFEHGTFREALEKAKKENKLIFMDCYTTWCGPCKYLAKNIFPQKQVGDFFNQHFVNQKMDMEKGEGVDLCKKYGVSSFPTLLFIDENGVVVHKLVGGMAAEELIEGAKGAIDPSLRIGALKAKYEDGNRNYEFLMTYLTALKRQYDRVNIPIVSNELIKKYSLDRFLTKELFYVVADAKIGYNSSEFKYLTKNKKAIKTKVEANEFDKVIERAIGSHLKEYIKTCTSLTDLQNEINKCKEVHVSPRQDKFEEELRYSFYINNNQLQTWFDLKLKDAQERKSESSYVFIIHQIGDEVVRNPKLSSSKEILDKTLKMAHQLAEDKQGLIMGNFLLAKLYLTTKDKEAALKHFNIFLDANGKAGGNNTHPTVTNVKKGIDAL